VKIVTRLLGLIIGTIFALSTTVLSEEFDEEGDRIHENHERAFFGFVKDANGSSVSDALVTFGAKGHHTGTTYTNSVGAYHISISKNFDASDIVISCEKPGYKQLRVLRRTAKDASPDAPVETECTLIADR
jgi:hypothetical protein